MANTPNTQTQASGTEYKQTARIIFDGDDHLDAYAILEGMDEKLSNEDRASAYFAKFYGKTGFRSFFNSIYVNTHDTFDKIKIAWRKLYDNIIKKNAVYIVTDYAYIYSYDSVWQESRYSSPCFISSDPKHFEPISFDRFFRSREGLNSHYDEGDNSSSLIQWMDCSFDFYAFTGSGSTGTTTSIRGKNFDVLIMNYYGMYNFDPVCDAGPILYPGQEEGRELMYYFPFLITTDGIQYYNMITLFKKKKHNKVCDIYRCLQYWVVDNGMFVMISMSKYVNGREEAGDYAYIYVPIDYKNKKTGKLVFINNAKYKHFNGQTQKYDTSSEIRVTINDCLVNCCVQMYDDDPEHSGYYRHMRRIWFTMDKKGNISEHYGLWDQNVYFLDSLYIPANGKTYIIDDFSAFQVYSLDLNGNYTLLYGKGYNTSETFDMFRTKPNSYIKLLLYTDNGDGSYNMYPIERDSYGEENTIKIGKVVTTRDFKTYTPRTIVNPCIIIPIPGRNKQLRIFLDNNIFESEKGGSTWNNYYNVKFWTNWAEKFSDTSFVRYIPKMTSNIRSYKQTAFFYKNGAQTGFSGFLGFLAIGEGDKVWYYEVVIGDLTLFTTSPKNFIVKEKTIHIHGILNRKLI